MKGTDVTPEQFAHAESFLRETAVPVPVIGAKTMLDVEHLIRLLAWYGAIRAKNGNVNPGRLVTRAADMSAAALECGAASEFIPAPELKDPRDERIRELVVALNESHAGHLKEYWARRTAESERDETRKSCDARDAVINELNTIIELSLGKELSALRLAQDAQNGGPAHDDTHTRSEWLCFMHEWLAKATDQSNEYEVPIHSEQWRSDAVQFESKLFAVAGLAVAAIQSSRRKRNG